MKKTRRLFAILMAVTVIGLNYQPVAASSGSQTASNGYYCTYSLSVTYRSASASLTASKSSGALANPLTAEIDALLVSYNYPNGYDYSKTVTQYDNGTYISCNTSYVNDYDSVYSSVNNYTVNGIWLQTFVDYSQPPSLRLRAAGGKYCCHKRIKCPFPQHQQHRLRQQFFNGVWSVRCLLNGEHALFCC